MDGAQLRSWQVLRLMPWDWGWVCWIWPWWWYNSLCVSGRGLMNWCTSPLWVLIRGLTAAPARTCSSAAWRKSKPDKIIAAKHWVSDVRHFHYFGGCNLFQILWSTIHQYVHHLDRGTCSTCSEGEECKGIPFNTITFTSTWKVLRYECAHLSIDTMYTSTQLTSNVIRW